MVLRSDSDGVVAIGQASHAWLSGQLARAWGNARFGPVEPWEEVCLGAEQHDIGMTGWDLEPTWNPDTGLPHSFMEMPLATHVDLWSAAPSRLLAQSRYAALLVSMHGAALYGRRNLDALEAADAGRVQTFLHGQRTLQERLVRDLRADPVTAAHAGPERVARNQRLVWTWDWISLALCLDWAPTRVTGVPTAGGGTADLAMEPLAGRPGAFTLDPWPFAGATVPAHCEGRRLDGRSPDEATLRGALGHAPWVTLRFELTRARAVPGS
jgi:hypothetical protein